MKSKKLLEHLNLATSGFFVDWDGRIRDAANPGAGIFCAMIDGDHMEVVNAEGETNFECTRYGAIEEIVALVPSINTEIVRAKSALRP